MFWEEFFVLIEWKRLVIFFMFRLLGMDNEVYFFLEEICREFIGEFRIYILN